MAENRDAEFTRFVERNSASLLRTAYLLTGDRHHAEDLVQSALASMYVRWGRLREPEAGEAYVRRILVNTHRTWCRRRSWHERPVGEIADTVAAPAAAEHDAELWRLLQDLSRHQRAVLVLRFYEDRSIEETAAILGVTSGTVKSQTHRALKSLRVRLSGAPAATHRPASSRVRLTVRSSW